MLEMK